MTIPTHVAFPSRLREASYDSTLWRYAVDAGIPLEEVTKPQFWALVADKMRPTDIIQVVADDLAYFAELLVLDAGRQWAKVKLLREVKIAAEETAPPPETVSEYEVCFRGARRWSVKRKSDNAIMSENHQTKEEATAWLVEHNRQMAA